MQPANIKSVGIIGAGRIGETMAKIARRAGRQVVIANRGGPESLTSVVDGLGDGVSAGTVKEAAGADIVVLAVMWPDVPQAVEGLEWVGTDLDRPDQRLRPQRPERAHIERGRRRLVAPARVVKAGNTFAAAVLAADPHEAGGERVIFVSGDNVDAKAEVIALFQDAGFFTVDLGALRSGGEMQQFHGPLDRLRQRPCGCGRLRAALKIYTRVARGPDQP